MSKSTAVIHLNLEEEQTLTRWVRAAATERRLVERARIILWAAQGQNAVEIAPRLGTRPARVSKWRQRFARDRLGALAAASRSGKPRRYAPRFAGCRSMSGAKVAEALDRARQEYGGRPESIACDNGSEFAGRVLEAWAMEQGVQLIFIRPRRPMENGFIESFNGRLRDEWLNVEWFTSLEDARRKLATWRYHYNHKRPHRALKDQTPPSMAETN